MLSRNYVLVQDRCIVGCAENKIAILLYRLVLTGAFVPNLLTAAQSVAMSFFGPQFYDPPAVRPHLILRPCLPVMLTSCWLSMGRTDHSTYQHPNDYMTDVACRNHLGTKCTVRELCTVNCRVANDLVSTLMCVLLWSQVVLRVVETQALVWLGAVFAPLLPALGLLSNALHFYTMKLLATFLYQPPANPYTASRTSNVAYSLMLGAWSCACCVLTTRKQKHAYRRSALAILS